MASKYAISRLVARDISHINFGARRDEFLAWIEAQADEGIATDALLGAMRFSKDPAAVLVEAARIYQEAVDNDQSPTAGTGVDTALADAIANAGSKFRGEWASGDLLWVDQLTALDATLWTLSNSSPTIGSPPAGSGHSSGLHLIGLGNGLVSATLDLSKVAALTGKSVNAMKFWDHGGTIFGAPPYTVKDGASTRYSGSDVAAWNHRTITLAGLDAIQWQFNSPGAGVYGELWLTGVEVYGAGQPYMLGEYVVAGGQMWQSKADNNGSTPGADGNWSQVPLNTNSAYATGSRPSAATLGQGAQIYDSTLHKPIWSDGTNWKDAAGTTV